MLDGFVHNSVRDLRFSNAANARQSGLNKKNQNKTSTKTFSGMCTSTIASN